MLPDTIALIVLEILKLVNWRLEHLPPDVAAKAAADAQADLDFWRRWLPKPPDEKPVA